MNDFQTGKRYAHLAICISAVATILNFAALSYSASGRNKIEEPTGPTVRDGIFSTSLVKIIANPEIYNGKRVLFIAYLKTGFEEKGLYISADDANLLNTRQALWLGELSEDIDWSKAPGNGYVMIVGTLQYTPKETGYGHLGLWLAELTNIEEILPYQDVYERRLNESKVQNKAEVATP